MCSTLILRRPGHDWPLILAGNRDERLDRPWDPPGRHWPFQPDVIGGLDRLGGGSWLALNQSGVIAVALNRQGTLGPMPGKRSRGDLVLEALLHADAAEAATALSALDPAAYRPFNLVLADNRDAVVLIHDGTRMRLHPCPPGLTMVTAMDPDSPDSTRIRFHRPRFAAAPAPDPDQADAAAWQALLASTERESGSGPEGAMRVERDGFGTSSAAILALPSPERAFSGTQPWFLFCPGPPGETPWTPSPTP